jgi:hypothetical protein
MPETYDVLVALRLDEHYRVADALEVPRPVLDEAVPRWPPSRLDTSPHRRPSDGALGARSLQQVAGRDTGELER